MVHIKKKKQLLKHKIYKKLKKSVKYLPYSKHYIYTQTLISLCLTLYIYIFVLNLMMNMLAKMVME